MKLSHSFIKTLREVGKDETAKNAQLSTERPPALKGISDLLFIKMIQTIRAGNLSVHAKSCV